MLSWMNELESFWGHFNMSMYIEHSGNNRSCALLDTKKTTPFGWVSPSNEITMTMLQYSPHACTVAPCCFLRLTETKWESVVTKRRLGYYLKSILQEKPEISFMLLMWIWCVCLLLPWRPLFLLVCKGHIYNPHELFLRNTPLHIFVNLQ